MDANAMGAYYTGWRTTVSFLGDEMRYYVLSSPIAPSPSPLSQLFVTSLSFLCDFSSVPRFASPSGLVGSGPNLFVVDSEAALIRGVNLIEGYSKTVLGGDKRGAFAGTATSSDLRQFEGFGDLDTAGYKVGVGRIATFFVLRLFMYLYHLYHISQYQLQ